MNFRDSNRLNRTVRLFPRLASANAAARASRRKARLAGLSNTDPIASARAQVKARLLEMILDNERVRRNERRPNQV
jgi:hypothetical protein